MRIIFKNKTALIILLTILVSNISFAQLFPNLGGQRTGTASLNFLKIGTGSRAAGMGNTFVAVANDITALYYNPAGLVEFKDNGMSFAYTQWFVDTKINNFGGVYHFGGNAVGVNVTSLQTEDMKVTTEFQPNGTGNYFRFSDLSIGASFARQMTEQFSFGVTLKYVEEKLGELKMQGVLGDIATYYKTGLGTSRFAIMISNFGSQVTPSGNISKVGGGEADSYQKFPPPTLFQFGFAIEPILDKKNRLTTSIQLNSPNDNAENFSLGAEYAYKEFLFFRGGWRFNTDAESFSAGVGFKFPISFANANFDYSVSNFDDLGYAQRFSLNILFPTKNKK